MNAADFQADIDATNRAIECHPCSICQDQLRETMAGLWMKAEAWHTIVLQQAERIKKLEDQVRHVDPPGGVCFPLERHKGLGKRPCCEVEGDAPHAGPMD